MSEAEIKERNEDLLEKFNELVEEKERCCNDATKKERQRIEKLIENLQTYIPSSNPVVCISKEELLKKIKGDGK